MPKIKRINSSETNISGTCFADSMLASYKDIFDKLGPPCDSFDNYKSDAEWILEFEDGTVATIYNWKNGKNYLGDDGLEVDQITEWNVGGHSKKDLDKLQMVFQVNKIKVLISH